MIYIIIISCCDEGVIDRKAVLNFFEGYFIQILRKTHTVYEAFTLTVTTVNKQTNNSNKLYYYLC